MSWWIAYHIGLTVELGRQLRLWCWTAYQSGRTEGLRRGQFNRCGS